MLFKPDIKLDKITDISLELLKEKGITALILDVDNTLSTHHGMTLTEGLEEWLALMCENGIKFIILSNSKEKRVKPFAQKINLEFVASGLKPLPFKFFTALKRLGASRRQAAVVGDQLFTDSLGAHLSGITAIILDPILPETMWGFRLKRYLEKILYSFYKF
ncbi:MAG: YqeG family HAD IIIA-type phosphatase [Clostridia bacterium]|nr:YqeG family HAD IIIA-type phosphatase [Clostridia bacterium]